jgi:hypothetical protein
MPNIIHLDMTTHHETENAVLVRNLKSKAVWLPKSQIKINDDGIQMPEWLAIEKELI